MAKKKLSEKEVRRYKLSEKELQRYEFPYVMPTSTPVYLKTSASTWDEFFRQVRQQFQVALGKSDMTAFTLKLIDDIVNEFRALLRNRQFNQRDAKAMTKIFTDMSWYGIPDQYELGDNLLDVRRAFNKLHGLWNEERFKNVKVGKQFRVPIDKKQLQDVIKKYRHPNGKPNWTRVGKALRVDPDTAKRRANSE